jgi:hypothetical protein
MRQSFSVEGLAYLAFFLKYLYKFLPFFYTE